MRITPALLFCCLLLGCGGRQPVNAPIANPVDETDFDDAGKTKPGGQMPSGVSDIKREKVAYSVGKESVEGFLCRPEKEGKRWPGLLLIHDANGLDSWVKDQAYRQASRGYVVLAVDLYRGETAKDVMEAHILERGLPEDRVRGDLKAAVDYLAGRDDVRDDKLGVAGFGMGGGYALETAVHDGRLRAVVNCYGRLITDPKQLASLRARVFYIYAVKDKGTTGDTIAQFVQAMNKAGKGDQLENMPGFFGCGYGFLDPANWSTYGQPEIIDVEKAWRLIDEFLDRQLKESKR
ncbi:MAG TPA: dienelactone hydrolase family protein [Gemmataceae bacterium]|jgi:carboxymethylenebutenolidase